MPTEGIQEITAGLSAHTVFWTLSLSPGEAAVAAARSTLADLADILKTVRFRDPADSLSCTAGIGSRVWTSITGTEKPDDLHPFKPVAGQVHTAIATDGDLFFHLRGDRADVTFELQRLLMQRLEGHVVVEDETVGFRYFDRRDLLGFVDGTANPAGAAITDATTLDDGSIHAGGSYLVTQKYLHSLDGWNKLRAEEQEAIVGRTKLDNVELDDAVEGQRSHKTLNTIVGEDGSEHEILRDNMPFGRPGAGEYGTFFIAYARELWVVERMLERMFVGDPVGLHDRVLDYSTPITGTTFFAPSAAFLEGLADA